MLVLQCKGVQNKMVSMQIAASTLRKLAVEQQS